jgi:hypothetical protein
MLESLNATNDVIDHVPATDVTRPTMREAYNRMRVLYEANFGKPDTRVWTDVVATCGDSYSGFIPPAEERLDNIAIDPFE